MNKLLLLLIALFFVGCKKENDTTDLLTRSWQVTAITTKTNTGASIRRDITSCDNNTIWTFKKDGSFSSEPSHSCISNGTVDVLNGNWTLTEKFLRIDPPGGSGGTYLDADIVWLTKSKLILQAGLTLDGRTVVRGSTGGGPGGSQLIMEFSSR